MKTTLTILLCLILSISGKAQNKDSIQSSGLVFELPLIDLPYHVDAAKTVNGGNATFGSFIKGYANPGMHQSLNLSADLYSGIHFGLGKLFKVESRANWRFGKRFLYFMTLVSSDFVLTYAPGFGGWEHEEYHRAVMTRFHVNSYDDMNKFPLGSEVISVSHVSDADLIRFKNESPADFIRMHVAGMEGEYLLVDKLQRNNFFYNQNLSHEIFYLFTTLNAIAYVQTCSNSKEADKLTDKMNEKENTVSVRDFTGLDFLGWTYDLFRPDEPYDARGIHPSGTGINRYIKTDDLTDKELSYLKKQGDLQWLNIISPMTIGLRSIEIADNGLYGNFSLHHYLTSFGNDITGSVFLMNPKYKFCFAFHKLSKLSQHFPCYGSTID